jgi:hypothetical protein
MNPSPTSQDAKKQCLEDLKMLGKDEYEEVFRIIKRNNVEYSENSNGIFFDLNSLSDDVFLKLVKFLDLCKAQRVDEASRFAEINTLRKESSLLHVQ